MKKLIIVFILIMLFPSASLAFQINNTYYLGTGKYEVGVDIEAGTYVVTPLSSNSFAAKVTIGDHLTMNGQATDSTESITQFTVIDPKKKSKISEKTNVPDDAVDSYVVTLKDDQEIYIHTDKVIFTLESDYDANKKRLVANENTESVSLTESENVIGSAISHESNIYDRCEKLAADIKSAEPIPGERYVVDLEDPTQYEWSSSNSDVVTIFENGTFVSMSSGKATIIGKPKDGNGSTIKISLTVNIPYVSSKDIVIDSPEGAELITYLGSGIIMTNYTGDDCFKVEKIDGTSIVDKSRILPVKEGKGAIVYQINMRKTIKVNITVKSSALMTEEEREALIEKAGENAQLATVTKGVNIRAEATSDSAKVGHADAGEELVVTQAFYAPKWHQILYDGEICYVSAGYVEIK